MATENITNSADYAKVTGTSGNDTIYNKGKNVTISASDGNDYIYNRGVWDDEGYSHPNIAPHRASILGGAGNDTIISDGDLVTIWGGDGDDSVNTTFNGGGAGDVYVYTGGNDTVDVNAGTFATFVLNGVSVNSSVTTGEPIAGIPADAHTILNLSNGKTLTVYRERPLIVSSFDDVPKINVVHNENSFTSITGLNQEGTVDYIDNSGHKVTITGDKSNYYISNWNSSPFKVNTGTGNDTVRTDTGDRSTIFTGAGNDTVYTSTSSNLIDLGDGNDSITGIAGSNNSIDAGDGNDVIMDNGGDTATGYSKINAGAGNDSIYIWHWSVNNTIHAGSGNDKVELNTSDNRIFLEDGDDIVNISGENRNLNIGEDGDSNFVDGGAGDDNFINSGNNTTINGGTGDDFISNRGENLLLTYTAGDGNDLILGFNETSTLNIAGGSYTTQQSGNDIIVTVGENKITLVGAGGSSAVNIEGIDDSGGDDTTPTALFTTNKTAKASLTGTTYGDEIYNYAKNVTIRGGEGGDLLTTMRKTSNVRIYGDAGDDTLEAYNATKVTLNGGAGNDEIYASGSTVTINAGAGNDSIELDSSKAQILYKAGEGNDVINGFSDTVTLKIGNGTTDTYKAEINGEDVVVKVGNEQLTISGAASWLKFDDTEEHPNILGTFVSIPILDDTAASSPYTVADEIETVDASARTKAIKITGNALDNSIVGGAGKDSLYGGDGNDILEGGKGNDKLYGQAGDDTLWGGTGNDTLTGGEGEDIFVYTGGKDVIADYVAGEDAISLGAAFADVTAKISGNNNVLTVGSGTLTIKGALGKELTLIDSTGTELSTVVGVKYFTNDDAANQTLDNAYFAGIATARTTAITITGNALANSIVGGAGKDTLYGGDGNDILEGGKGNDKLYGQAGDDTLWGGAGNDTLTGGEGEDMFVYTGGKDVIADYAAGEDAISLGAAFADVTAKISGNNNVLTVGSGTLTIKGALGKELMLIDSTGTELSTVVGVKYFTNDDAANQTLDNAYFAGIATARSSTKAIKITGNALANSIVGGSGKDTLYGGEGTDILEGGKGNDKLYGEDGDDTLWGGTGNDTLTGGEGEDMFVYTGGKDVIADYVAGEDTILLGAALSKATLSGNNVVLTVGSGTLTIKDGKGKELYLIDADGNESKITVDNKIYLDNSAGATTLAADVEYADATARTKAIRIVGNDLNNTILGGSGKDILYGGEGEDSLLGNAGDDKLYGEDGDDTLYGGAGTDSLWGGEGADVFVYADGDGKDLIYDFDEDDMLAITGDWTGSYNIGTNTVAIKVGTTEAAITLEDFTATNFNINGDLYKISGTKLVKK